MCEDAAPTVDDYAAADGFDASQGVDVCPHCRTALSPNGGVLGPVWDRDGERYETIFDTDPGDRPFFCGDCYAKLTANKHANENRGLGEFA